MNERDEIIKKIENLEARYHDWDRSTPSERAYSIPFELKQLRERLAELTAVTTTS